MSIEFQNSLSFARALDRNDELRLFRNQFHIPKHKGKSAIYFTGNSLGLQPKATKQFLLEELSDWATLGGEGHLNARRPWLYYHKFTKKALAQLTGAKVSEVVAMNQLTTNLHLMMVTFYRPDAKRYKILTEAGAFPSDQYAFESQIKFHGFKPDETLIELSPRKGEHTLRTGDILSAIEEHSSELALVIFGGVQYYTGQFFDIQKITAAGHRVGAYVGFDLAHAIGNTPLNLHRHNVDFAVWCSYKYLNAGPGGLAGAFVHERHGKNFSLPRFAGWWGHNERDRFKMEKGFQPMAGIDGWQLSNVPILQAAALMASLNIFREAGINGLRKKSVLLSKYMEFLLSQVNQNNKYFTILTPTDLRERGCQFSLYFPRNGKRIFDSLTKAGIVVDYREPNVIRVAPVPLYNTFQEVFQFTDLLYKILE
jgi:kynureninase